MNNAVNALMPFTAELLEEIVREHPELDYTGEQFAPRALPAAIRVFSWKSVEEELPDDETSVLVFAPNDSEPVWIGFHEDGKWRSPCGMPLTHRVTHWAHLPEPPTM
jgi:hypothetical protein